jgi:two-component system, NtrC family, response regulator AtoC
MMDAHILVIASSERTIGALTEALERRGHCPLVARTAAEGLGLLEQGPIALVVIALPLPDMTARPLMNEINREHRGLGVIISGTDDDVKTAIDALDLGVHDYLDDPHSDTSEFLATVGVALGSRRGDRHLRYLREKDASGTGWQAIVGESVPLKKVVSILRQVCARTSNGGTPTILFNGETGTGKGYVAKCVHYNGARRHQPFVEVNCAALPPNLIESELFGYERGAFTDAKAMRPGLFETANGGTLFLDEIGAVPLDLQAKLLTAIEEKTVRRIGGRQPVRVNVQIIAATHENLELSANEGSFRSDLFHRLNVVAVRLPSLRERGEDILLLAEAFVRASCREYGIVPRTLSDDAKTWMMHYAWPGNVRELRNQIERVVLLENDDHIRAEHFRASTIDGAKLEVSQANGSLRVSLPPNGVPLETLEREVLRAALERCDGNVSRAARYLSITRQTLIYRMKKHGLEVGSRPVGVVPRRE